MSLSTNLRPIIGRTLSTMLGIAGLAELDGTAGLVPADLVHDRRGELSESRTRSMLRTGDGPRQLAQLAQPGPIAAVLATTDYEYRRAAELASRRAMFGRNATKGGRPREWVADGGAAAAPAAPAVVGASLLPKSSPCVGCKS